MTVPAEVRTERLLLRQWRADDAERMAEIYAEPRFLEHMPAHDLAETRAQLERFARGWREHGYSHWAVEEASSGRLTGRAGLLRHDDWPLAEMYAHARTLHLVDGPDEVHLQQIARRELRQYESLRV